MDETNEEGRTFDDWEHEANAACIQLSGLSIHDLPDGPSYDAWEACESPEEYAIELLAAEGFDAAPSPSPSQVVDVDITPVTYGDGSDAAAIAAEDVRRANWRPSNQYRNGRYVKSSYLPTNEALTAALRIRKAGAPLPRLY